jgi:hypothetical protein
VEQTYEPMYKNRIGGIRCRTSWPLTAKSISIKGTGCKFGGCVRKAVELTSGDLLRVANSRLKALQGALISQQKSAAGILATRVVKAQTVIVSSSARLSWMVMRQPIRFGGACQGRIG